MATTLHGGMDQADRDSTLADYKNKVSTLMIATSLAARGLDVKVEHHREREGERESVCVRERERVCVCVCVPECVCERERDRESDWVTE